MKKLNNNMMQQIVGGVNDIKLTAAMNSNLLAFRNEEDEKTKQAKQTSLSVNPAMDNPPVY